MPASWGQLSEQGWVRPSPAFCPSRTAPVQRCLKGHFPKGSHWPRLHGHGCTPGNGEAPLPRAQAGAAGSSTGHSPAVGAVPQAQAEGLMPPAYEHHTRVARGPEGLQAKWESASEQEGWGKRRWEEENLVRGEECRRGRKSS